MINRRTIGVTLGLLLYGGILVKPSITYFDIVCIFLMYTLPMATILVYHKFGSQSVKWYDK